MSENGVWEEVDLGISSEKSEMDFLASRRQRCSTTNNNGIEDTIYHIQLKSYCRHGRSSLAQSTSLPRRATRPAICLRKTQSRNRPLRRLSSDSPPATPKTRSLHSSPGWRLVRLRKPCLRHQERTNSIPAHI